MKSFIERACNELYAVDDFSEKHYSFKAKFVSFQEYIRIFVQVNTSSPSQIPTDLKIFFFNTLLQYIVQHKKQDKLKEIQTWTKNDYENSKNEIHAAQIFLKNSNVAELLTETLKHT